MESRFLMTLQVAVAGVQKMGAVPYGTRSTALISGGHFEGPRLRGKACASSSRPRYAFLNRLLAVASGDRRPEGPIYTIEEIL